MTRSLTTPRLLGDRLPGASVDNVVLVEAPPRGWSSAPPPTNTPLCSFQNPQDENCESRSLATIQCCGLHAVAELTAVLAVRRVTLGKIRGHVL